MRDNYEFDKKIDKKRGLICKKKCNKSKNNGVLQFIRSLLFNL